MPNSLPEIQKRAILFISGSIAYLPNILRARLFFCDDVQLVVISYRKDEQ